MWSTTAQQSVPNEWTSQPTNSQWQWNVVSKQSGWPEAPSANLNGYSTSWTPITDPQMPAKPKLVQKPHLPADSPAIPTSNQQYYFVPVSSQSSWDYVVPAPMTAMKKEVPQIIVAPQQQKPRPKVEFVNVKTGPNSWGSKTPKKPQEDPISINTSEEQKPKKVEIEDELTQQSLYKTELCRSWTETGACRYGNKCQFAHGKDEVRPIMRHPKYKTEICKTFHTQGTCPYGTRCRFIHNPSLRASHLQQQQQQQQQHYPVVEQTAPHPAITEHVTPVAHSQPIPVVSPPQMIPQPTHSIWSTPLLVPSPVSDVPIESAFGSLTISPSSTSPSSVDDSPSKRASLGRLPIFQRFTN